LHADDATKPLLAWLAAFDRTEVSGRKYVCASDVGALFLYSIASEYMVNRGG